MTERLELDWLTEKRPLPLRLDPSSTDRVRAELLAGRTNEPTARSSWRIAHRLRARSWRLAVYGTALAAIGSAVLLATGNGATGASSGLGSLAVQSASAKQLTRLSTKLASDAAPIGNATLVLRSQTYPDGSSITGADLYADDGRYYYAPTLSGLPAAARAGDTVNNGASDQAVRDIAAAKAALTEPINQAREQMSVANLDPGVTPKTIFPNDATARPEMSRQSSMVWSNSIEALIAGAGDPQVQAGALKLLATVPQINVVHDTVNGQPALVLTAAMSTSKSGIYQEQLTLDADTGMPIKITGGNAGQAPSVTIDYKISRTTVASAENSTNTGKS